jgi:hypothetical protein
MESLTGNRDCVGTWLPSKYLPGGQIASFDLKFRQRTTDANKLVISYDPEADKPLHFALINDFTQSMKNIRHTSIHGISISQAEQGFIIDGISFFCALRMVQDRVVAFVSVNKRPTLVFANSKSLDCRTDD